MQNQQKDELNTLFDALNEKPIAYHRVYAKITGSVTAGLLLSQLVYWAKTMKWQEFYKTNLDIREETNLGETELKNAKNKLLKLKIITVKRKGIPAKTFYTLNRKKIINLITSSAETAQLDKRKPLDSVSGKRSSITENKQENNAYTNGTHAFSEKKSPETKKKLNNSSENFKCSATNKIIKYYYEVVSKQTTSGKVIVSKKVNLYIQELFKKFTPVDLILAIKGFSEDKWQLEHNGFRGLEWFFKSSERIVQNIGRFRQFSDINKFEKKAENFFK